MIIYLHLQHVNGKTFISTMFLNYFCITRENHTDRSRMFRRALPVTRVISLVSGCTGVLLRLERADSMMGLSRGFLEAQPLSPQSERSTSLVPNRFFADEVFKQNRSGINDQQLKLLNTTSLFLPSGHRDHFPELQLLSQVQEDKQVPDLALASFNVWFIPQLGICFTYSTEQTEKNLIEIQILRIVRTV